MPDDHFSAVASQYARSRPTYPDILFDWLAQSCDRHDFACVACSARPVSTRCLRSNKRSRLSGGRVEAGAR